MDKINWHWYAFEELPVAVLYSYLRLREQAFIVEQKCAYPDLDNYDQPAQHLLGFTPEGQVAACARLLPPESKYPEPSLGRIVVSAEFRGQQLGNTLVNQGVQYAKELFPGKSIRIQAQAHLQTFYAQHGFKAQGSLYDEDGIAHVDMFL